MAVTWRDYEGLLRRYLAPHRARVEGLAAVLLMTTALQLTAPQVLRYFVDTASEQGPMQALAMAGWAYLLCGVLEQGGKALNTYLGADLGWRTTNALRADLALHCLRLDMPFHHARTPGEMIERIDGDVNQLAQFLSQFLVTVANSVLLLAGTLLVLTLTDWRIGLPIAGLAGLALAALMAVRNIAVPAEQARREQVAGLMGYVEERLAGLDDVRANGLGGHVMRGFHRLRREIWRLSMRAAMARNLLWVVSMGFVVSSNLCALILGAILCGRGELSIGQVYMVVQYNAMLRMPLDQLVRQMQDLQQAGAGLLRVRELLAERPAIADGPGASLPAGPLSVEFDGVTFAYGDGAPVLHDVRLTLAPGEVLGVLGRTGSGKSTLTRLLFRLYEPQQGAVRLGGVDIRELTLPQLRRSIGMVTQEVQLFHATVRDNLTFFDAAIPDARILQVVDDLGLSEWLARMPDGLDTMLQAGGAGLSAGESQLLAFTRVFLTDPGLVLLDEPSSRLDPATERLIDRAVDRLLRGRTCLIIAHRLGTVQRADSILVLEDGRIVEHGARAALAAGEDTRFGRMLRAGMAREGV